MLFLYGINKIEVILSRHSSNNCAGPELLEAFRFSAEAIYCVNAQACKSLLFLL